MEKMVRVDQLTAKEREVYFLTFKKDVSHLSAPKNFTFPFYYTPHSLALQAAQEMQSTIEDIPQEVYNFGLHTSSKGMGKMFGVLVVDKPDGTRGYLAAFSGKVGEQSHFKPFVPPVFNRLTQESFYLNGEAILNTINAEIKQLEESEAYHRLKITVEHAQNDLEEYKSKSKTLLKTAKQERDAKRKLAKENTSLEAFEELQSELAHESIARQLKVKHTTAMLHLKVNEAKEQFNEIAQRIHHLKEERKRKSASLQKALHQSYLFKNARKEQKDVAHIFSDFSGIQPPAGAGECAAPKLLNFAYIAGWKPICMAEFWYGKSPSGEVRKHMHFYPACRSKCEPILGFMLQGLEVDENPILKAESKELELTTLYEDEAMVVVNKPSGLLSVPGKEKSDSVYERVMKEHTGLSGPVIVHRLDMCTSGIMVLAKTKRDHKKLQQQFIERTAKKRYVAVLEKKPLNTEGSIELPLRVDLDNRPHQMVCYEYGKPAFTRYHVINYHQGKTRVYFYPHTGRTHQLRVHAAHPNGLNAPIVGDDLYGKKERRLMLHAEQLKITHPRTGKQFKFTCSPDF